MRVAVRFPSFMDDSSVPVSAALPLGVGIDLVEIPRLEASLQRTGEVFLSKVYHPRELEGLPPNPARRLEFLAGRWAAKEAFSKALGTGITERCALKEICVLNREDGSPVMTLEGAALCTAEERGVKRILLSLSHEKNYATAIVLLLG